MIYAWLATASLVLGLAALFWSLTQLRSPDSRHDERCKENATKTLYLSAIFFFLALIFIILNITSIESEKQKIKKRKARQLGQLAQPLYVSGQSRRPIVAEQQVFVSPEPSFTPSTNTVRLNPGSSLTILSN